MAWGVGVSVGVAVGAGVGVSVGVAVGAGVAVGGTGVGVGGGGVSVAVAVGVGVSVGVAVGVGVSVGVDVTVGVGVTVGVLVGVGKGKGVGVRVGLGERVGVGVGVPVPVGVMVGVLVGEGVAVGIGVSVASGVSVITPKSGVDVGMAAAGGVWTRKNSVITISPTPKTASATISVIRRGGRLERLCFKVSVVGDGPPRQMKMATLYTADSISAWEPQSSEPDLLSGGAGNAIFKAGTTGGSPPMPMKISRKDAKKPRVSLFLSLFAILRLCVRLIFKAVRSLSNDIEMTKSGMAFHGATDPTPQMQERPVWCPIDIQTGAGWQ